ncbi:MAG TPA: class I SAM-dependent methyltransferase [Armatimonadota bacterium]|jgi:SAM-dependent methyltransferase
MRGNEDQGRQADRLRVEEHFHDEWALHLKPEEVLVDESWSAATCPEHRWIRTQLGDVAGLRILDLGCGAGEAAVWFAKQGAHVTACDLSSEFLNLVSQVAALHHVDVELHRADADSLLLPEGSFDVVYAGNLLHHVDVRTTLRRISDVLKPGGVLVSWDPLAHNPVINAYRRLANGVRTPGEHPLKLSDLRLFDEFFAEVRTEFFWLTTLALFLRFFAIERVHPSAQRYWKKIITEHERLTPQYNRLEKVDSVLLKWCPWLKRYCWNVAVIARKSK